MKYAKQFAVLTMLSVVAFGMMGCPLETFYVTYPTNSQNYTVNAADQLVMTVRFVRDVDVNSLQPGVNVILDTDTTSNAVVSIRPGATASEVIITTRDTFDTLLTFDSDGFFTLNFTDDGVNPPVMSADAEALDGDKNNIPGGNWSHTYTMLG